MIVCCLGVIENGQGPLAIVVLISRFTLAGLQHHLRLLELGVLQQLSGLLACKLKLLVLAPLLRAGPKRVCYIFRAPGVRLQRTYL